MAETLDLGCGLSKTPGALGVDIMPGRGVDMVYDLNRVPWPLESGRFDRVVCSHVLEHLANVLGVLNEIHRVSRPGALVQISTPHFSSLNSWEDPTHLHHFALCSFSFFDPQSKHRYGSCALRTVKTELTFGSGLWDRLGRLQYACFPRLWEKHFCFIFRARNLFVELQVIKDQTGGIQT